MSYKPTFKDTYKNNFSVAHINIESLQSHWFEFCNVFDSEIFDVIAVPKHF